MRKLPKRLDDGAPAASFISADDWYRKLYFEVIDVAASSLAERFSGDSLDKLCAIEQTLFEAINVPVPQVKTDRLHDYSDLISLEMIETELKLMSNVKQTYNFLTGEHVEAVTSMQTVLDIMKCVAGHKLFPQVDKLIRIYMTSPVTTSSVERSFSCLRRLKNYLRSSMTQVKLNNVMLLHVHKTLTECLDEEQIAKEFINAVATRELYFGRR